MKLSLFLRLGLVAVCLALLGGCNDAEIEEMDIRPGTGEEKVILAYMSGDNNLSRTLEGNIRQMHEAMAGVSGRIVVYMDGSGSLPYLVSIDGTGKMDTVRTYKEMNSSDPAVVKRVLEDMMDLCPASSYGLIFSSHGKGWLPAEDYGTAWVYPRLNGKEREIRTRWFGFDNSWEEGGVDSNDKTGIPELAAVLPDHVFEFILFDACHMAGIEVFYSFRNKADYLIASPAEIMFEGFPYDELTPDFWKGEEGLVKVCRQFADHYRNVPVAADRNATVCMVRTSGLEDVMLAARGILQGRYDEIHGSDFSDVWHYPLINTDVDIFADFREFIRNACNGSRLEHFETVLDRCILYCEATETYDGEKMPEGKFCGLSVFIPQAGWSSYDGYYRNLEWARAVYQIR